MKNKKILICIGIILVIGISTILIIYMQNKNIKKINNSISQTYIESSNTIENIILENNEIIVNEVLEETQSQTDEVIEEKTEQVEERKVIDNKQETIKSNNQETKTQVETPKTETPKQTESTPTPQVVEKVEKQKTINCDDIHRNIQGNCSIWFSTQDQAVSYYNNLIAEKERKMQEKMQQATSTEERDRIFREEGLKCPYGYELISCPICNKWTLNMYYR